MLPKFFLFFLTRAVPWTHFSCFYLSLHAHHIWAVSSIDLKTLEPQSDHRSAPSARLRGSLTVTQKETCGVTRSRSQPFRSSSPRDVNAESPSTITDDCCGFQRTETGTEEEVVKDCFSTGRFKVQPSSCKLARIRFSRPSRYVWARFMLRFPTVYKPPVWIFSAYFPGYEKWRNIGLEIIFNQQVFGSTFERKPSSSWACQRAGKWLTFNRSVNG